MPKSFLSSIAENLISEFGSDMSKVHVVFPNRRAGRFLKKELMELAEETILAPQVRSVEDFVRDMCGLDIIDSNALMLEFFQVYKRVSKADDTTLSQFLRWATTFLADVDEVDLEMVDAKALFETLYSAKRIESWELNEEGVTEFQQRHLDHVSKFSSYYDALHSSLMQRGMAYRGMAYRTLADMLASEGVSKRLDHVWFVGFNALYKAEEKIMSTLVDSGIGRVFFDVDDAYLSDSVNEAGSFFRAYRQDRALGRDFKVSEGNLNELERKVQTVPVPGSVGQVEAAATILSNISAEADFNPIKTAIVLNDNKLLQPLLSALPSGQMVFNLTMGFPFRQSALSQFVDSWLTFQIYGSENPGKYHHRILETLVTQLLTVQIIGNSQPALVQLTRSQVYIPSKEIDLIIADSDVAKLLLSQVAGPSEAIDRLTAVCNSLQSGELSGKVFGVDEYLGSLIKILADLSGFFQIESKLGGLHELQMIWNQLKRQTQVPFEGEPLQGVQVMGMLETRVLDFENVIMIGANEGSLPANSDKPTYIPFDIRRQAEMRTDRDQDAVASYHFQRLMQRCSNAYLIYDSDADSPSKGEASRFIAQVQMEPWKNTSVSKLKIDLPSFAIENGEEISIDKGTFELQALAKYFERGISPSGLNAYLSCKLKFYYRYILKLGEADELSESMDHAEFGTVVHDALEAIYKPFLDQELTVERLKEKRAIVGETIERHFLNTMKHLNEVAGRDLLYIGVAKGYVDKVIERDIAYLKKHGSGSLQIIDVEMDASRTLEFDLPSPFTTVSIGGRIDRIDRLETGALLVLDYKTGSVKPADLKAKTVEVILDNQKDKIIQLALYGLMLEGAYSKTETFKFGIASLRNDSPPFLLEVEGRSVFQLNEINETVGPLIRSVIREMASDSVPFDQTEDLKKCDYCQYAGICNR